MGSNLIYETIAAEFEVGCSIWLTAAETQGV